MKTLMNASNKAENYFENETNAYAMVACAKHFFKKCISWIEFLS